MNKLRFVFLCCVATLTLNSVSLAKNSKLKASLDPFITLSQASEIKPSDLENLFKKEKFKKNPYFRWLNKEQSRAIFKKKPYNNLQIDLNIIENRVSIEEAIVDFENNTFKGITISIFNRGDGGYISKPEFKRKFDTISEVITSQLGKKPRKRVGNTKKGIMTTGLVWETSIGKAVLVHNNDAHKKVEFLRLRLSPESTEGIYEAALEDRSFATVRKSKLRDNVIKKDGNVYIDSIPMVDQGSKGYCVVASAQRLFEYYGIACDMHQLAQIAKSDPKKGTSSILINKELGSIDYLFQTRFTCLGVKYKNNFVKLKDNNYIGKSINKKNFYKLIYSNIDKGIPLLWSLNLGLKPETPNLNPQTSGGHMRMIIGYNLKENKIIFSDSWGLGHSFKTMDADDFYVVTNGIFTMVPTNY